MQHQGLNDNAWLNDHAGCHICREATLEQARTEEEALLLHRAAGKVVISQADMNPGRDATLRRK